MLAAALNVLVGVAALLTQQIPQCTNPNPQSAILNLQLISHLQSAI